MFFTLLSLKINNIACAYSIRLFKISLCGGTGDGSSEHYGEDTMKVYNLIVQNPDVIKGVFHAHQHWNL